MKIDPKSKSLFVLAFLFAACVPSKPQIVVQEMEIPESENSSLPRLYSDESGNVNLSFVRGDDEFAELYVSFFEGNSWTAPSLVSSGENWFVNWADFPSVITHDKNIIAAHWLQKTHDESPYAYAVNIALNGNNNSPIKPHSDDTPTEHGFVSMLPYDENHVLAIWLDGRNMAGMNHEEYTEENRAMTLRSSILGENSVVLDEFVVDARVCDCCTTSMVSTPNSFIVAYRNRSDEEIRDIYTARFVNGEWQQPKVVHNDGWQINGCPVNGPAIDAIDNKVAVAWYTLANSEPKVQVAFSNDEGETYSAPIRVDDGRPAGRVAVVQNPDGSTWVSWIEEIENGAEYRVKKFNKNGSEIASATLASVTAGRRSGFPQLVSSGSGLFAAWTDTNGGSRVKLAKISTK